MKCEKEGDKSVVRNRGRLDLVTLTETMVP